MVSTLNASSNKILLSDYEVQLKAHTWENILKSLVEQVRFPRVRERNLPTRIEVAYDVIIAKRWSSFYPTFFNVFGGGYIIRCMSRTNESLIVVDPGFNFFSTMKSLALDPRCIKSVVLTHNHPDHTGNLDEFFTLMAELNARSHLYVNQSCYEACRAVFATSVSRPQVLKPGERLHVIDVKEKHRRKEKTVGTVYLEATRAHHWEIGGFHEALGLKFELFSFDNGKKSKATIGITGDTDGSIGYLDEYVDAFSDVDLLILHVGTWYDKQIKGDKHLYADGTKELLKRIYKEKRKKTRVVVLSEFGLEMANLRLIARALRPFTYVQELPSVRKIITRRSYKRTIKILDLLRRCYDRSVTDDQLVRLVKYGILYPPEMKDALVQHVDLELGLLDVIEEKIQKAKLLKVQPNQRDQVAYEIGRNFAHEKDLSRLDYLAIFSELTDLLNDLRYNTLQMIRQDLRVRKTAEQALKLSAREAFFDEVFDGLGDPRIEVAEYLSKMLHEGLYIFPGDVGNVFRIAPSNSPLDQIKVLARKGNLLDYVPVKSPHRFDFVLREDSTDPLLFGTIEYILKNEFC